MVGAVPGGRDKAEPQKVKLVFRHSTSLIRMRPLDVLVAGICEFNTIWLYKLMAPLLSNLHTKIAKKSIFPTLLIIPYRHWLSDTALKPTFKVECSRPISGHPVSPPNYARIDKPNWLEISYRARSDAF
jgi:hypothetical protein